MASLRASELEGIGMPLAERLGGRIYYGWVIVATLALTETVAVQILPQGATRRIDTPAPGNCPHCVG